MSINKKTFIYLFPFLLLIIDQLTKHLMLFKAPSEGIFLIEKTNFTFGFDLTKNPNLAFSISLPQYIIYIIVISLILTLSYCLYRAIKQKNNLLIFSFLLIILGAISNLIDRIIHGAVIDFISFQIMSFQFAVFNLADVWIVIGVFILLFKEPFKNK